MCCALPVKRMETLLTRKKYEDNLLLTFIQVIVLPPVLIIYVLWTLASTLVICIEMICVSALQLFLSVILHLGLVISIPLFGIGSLLLVLTSTETDVAFTLIGASFAFMLLYVIVDTSSIDIEDVNRFSVFVLNISLVGFGLLSYSFEDLSWFAAASTVLVGILGLSGSFVLQEF